MAVRADGTGLLCAQTQHRGRSWETVVYTVNLATGEPRVLAEAVPGPVTELSWAADARTVAFEWNPAMGRAGARQAGIYMTDPAARPGWEASSRLVTPSDDGPGPLISPVISRDGTAVYVTAAQASLAGGSHWNRLLEVPAGGGQPRVLFELRYQANPANLAYMWDDVPAGPLGPVPAPARVRLGLPGRDLHRGLRPHPLPGVRARNSTAASLFHRRAPVNPGNDQLDRPVVRSARQTNPPVALADDEP